MTESQAYTIGVMEGLIELCESILGRDPSFRNIDLRKISPSKRAQALNMLEKMENEVSKILFECEKREIPEELVDRIRKMKVKIDEELKDYSDRLGELMDE